MEHRANVRIQDAPDVGRRQIARRSGNKTGGSCRQLSAKMEMKRKLTLPDP